MRWRCQRLLNVSEISSGCWRWQWLVGTTLASSIYSTPMIDCLVVLAFVFCLPCTNHHIRLKQITHKKSRKAKTWRTLWLLLCLIRLDLYAGGFDVMLLFLGFFCRRSVSWSLCGATWCLSLRLFFVCLSVCLPFLFSRILFRLSFGYWVCSRRVNPLCSKSKGKWEAL